MLLFYLCLAYATLPDESKIPIENRIGILLLIIAVFFLAFLPFAKSGSRCMTFYHNSSDGDDQLIRYAIYVSYVAFYACIASLKWKRKDAWLGALGSFFYGSVLSCFVYLRFKDYPSGLSVGYYVSLFFIIGIFLWLRE